MIRIPRLCITSPWIYPLFVPEHSGYFGGWEVRIALIAKELARRGRLNISLVVGDHGQPHIEQRDSVTLYSWIGREIWGIPVRQIDVSAQRTEDSEHCATITSRLRRFLMTAVRASHRSVQIRGQVGPYEIVPTQIAIYDEVDADIYMVPGNSQFSGEAAFYAMKRRKKYVFLAGSDMDYYPEYKTQKDKLDIYSVPHALKCFAIEAAAAHIVQNEGQARMLEIGYQRRGTVIPNPIDLDRLFQRSSCPKTILWVGKSDERVKRPSLILKLAKQLQQFEFVIIMNKGLPETHQECVAAAKELANVRIIERVPFAEIETYFAQARLHLNTSLFEGFPNTFLQAAKYGVPTISLQVDPGGMLSRHGSGVVCGGNFERFMCEVLTLMSDDSVYNDISEKALKYVRCYHDKDSIIERYERSLMAILKGQLA